RWQTRGEGCGDGASGAGHHRGKCGISGRFPKGARTPCDPDCGRPAVAGYSPAGLAPGAAARASACADVAAITLRSQPPRTSQSRATAKLAVDERNIDHQSPG